MVIDLDTTRIAFPIFDKICRIPSKSKNRKINYKIFSKALGIRVFI